MFYWQKKNCIQDTHREPLKQYIHREESEYEQCCHNFVFFVKLFMLDFTLYFSMFITNFDPKFLWVVEDIL